MTSRKKPAPKKPDPIITLQEVLTSLQPLIDDQLFGKNTKYVQSAVALLMVVLTLVKRTPPASEPRRSALVRPRNVEAEFFDMVDR